VKSTARPQSATSLPRAPRDDAGSRTTKYLVMMTIRIVCFALMALVTPYGWYTWVFAAAAIFLPYIAVVIANVGQDTKTVRAVRPEHEIAPDAAETPVPEAPAAPAAPPVIRIRESGAPADGPGE
jgi:hypothetical protein